MSQFMNGDAVYKRQREGAVFAYDTHHIYCLQSLGATPQGSYGYASFSQPQEIVDTLNASGSTSVSMYKPVDVFHVMHR